METLVKNPETGRWIKKGGTVYNNLKEKGVKISQKQTKQRRSFVPKDIQQKNVPIEINRQFSIDKSSTKWQEKKPTLKNQRKVVKDKCGESCFLIPESLKFPICNKVSNKQECSYNCRGIKAAAARAGEWKYNNVLKKAKATATNLDCYKTKK